MTDDTTKLNLQEILMNPLERKRILETLRANKPKHWSSRSNSPYYNPRTAIEMKFVLDRMMETKLDEMYFYKDFPRFKRTTLYAKVNQGIKYLLDNLDPDGKYAFFWSCIYFHTLRNVGLKFELRHDLLKTSVDATELTCLPTQLSLGGDNGWKDRMEVFLRDGEANVPFIINGIVLTEDEVQDLNNRFMPLESIVARISNKEIKLVKLL